MPAMLSVLAPLFVVHCLGALPDNVPVVQIKGVNANVAMPLAGLGTWLYPDSVLAML